MLIDTHSIKYEWKSQITALFVKIDTYKWVLRPTLRDEIGLGIAGLRGQYQYQYLEAAEVQYQYQYQYLKVSDGQYQYQYQYLKNPDFNTNTNTNTAPQVNTSIPIPGIAGVWLGPPPFFLYEWPFWIM